MFLFGKQFKILKKYYHKIKGTLLMSLITPVLNI